MYEMFLGPVEQSKPWDTKGIEGVHRFLRKLWRLFFDEIKGKMSVLLDTHFNDQAYAMDVGKALLENQIQAFINPQEDDPRKNINLLADRISRVTKLIFFYGMVSRDWVLERMSAALQVIVTNNYPIDDFFIYLAPPLKDPNDISLKQRFLKVSVIDDSANWNADKAILNKFLKNLKGEAI
jgi:hypothetical protein